jgi:hypothetical protein
MATTKRTELQYAVSLYALGLINKHEKEPGHPFLRSDGVFTAGELAYIENFNVMSNKDIGSIEREFHWRVSLWLEEFNKPPKIYKEAWEEEAEKGNPLAEWVTRKGE